MDQSGGLCRDRQRDWLLHRKCISVGPGLDPEAHFQHKVEKHVSLGSGSSTSGGDAKAQPKRGGVTQTDIAAPLQERRG